jgi:hypothetical protein
MVFAIGLVALIASLLMYKHVFNTITAWYLRGRTEPLWNALATVLAFLLNVPVLVAAVSICNLLVRFATKAWMISGSITGQVTLLAAGLLIVMGLQTAGDARGEANLMRLEQHEIAQVGLAGSHSPNVGN